MQSDKYGVDRRFTNRVFGHLERSVYWWTGPGNFKYRRRIGIANGSEVIIKQVVPHPDDYQEWNEYDKQIVKLSRPPICVFVELLGTDHDVGEYVPGRPGWFPICVSKKEWRLPRIPSRKEQDILSHADNTNAKVLKVRLQSSRPRV